MSEQDMQHSIQGWQAELNMGFRRSQGKTVLSRLNHFGPLRVQRPFYPEQDVCHVYMLHPPGGLVGGDQLVINIHCEQHAHSLLTTPGSTKFYRSAGDYAEVTQNITVEEGGIIEWFPQENILFPGAKAKIKTQIHLTGSAQFIGWEINCLGRPVNNERFFQGSMDSLLLLYRDNIPQLLERLKVNSLKHLNASTGLRNYPMQATFIATGCGEAELELVRNLLAEIQAGFPHGVTLVDGMLLLRVLGERTEKIQRLMIPVWQALRPSLLGKQATVPRIWAT